MKTELNYKKIVASIHLSGTAATWSSTETTLWKILSEEEVEKGQDSFLKSLSILSSQVGFTSFDEEDQYIDVWHLQDTTFQVPIYRGCLSVDNTKTMGYKELVQSYLNTGWSPEEPVEIQMMWDRQAADHKHQRKLDGYLFVDPSDWKNFHIEDYYGGFSDEVVYDAYLQKYLASSGVFGYIGHSVRKVLLDSYIEDRFKEEVNKRGVSYTWHSLFAMWLTSTNGRHFGDSLEGHSYHEQQRIIDSRISDIVDTAIYYMDNEK